MARHMNTVTLSASRTMSKQSFQVGPDADLKPTGRVALRCGFGLLALGALTLIPTAPVLPAQIQNDGNCTVAITNGQGQMGKTARTPQDNNGQKLADCGGVLKPPATADADLEKPAPQGGKTPVIPPGNTPDQQENDNAPQSQ